MLTKLIKKYGPKKWAKIAQKIPQREGKQCWERWHNHLDPNIKKIQWSEKEEWLLYLLF